MCGYVGRWVGVFQGVGVGVGGRGVGEYTYGVKK